jgi:hypothetical protein
MRLTPAGSTAIFWFQNGNHHEQLHHGEGGASFNIDLRMLFLRLILNPVQTSFFLKRRSLGLELTKEWLMCLSIFGGEVIDKQDAMEVVVLMLGGA